MDDEKLKKIIEEAVGNNDPFWINSAYEIVKKIISFPDGTEFSIRQLVNDKQASGNYLFSIYNCVSTVCEKIGISLTSKHKGAIVGMPYNIQLVKNSKK